MIICKKCGIAVNNYGKHLRRNRCKAHHIRHDRTTPDRGLRGLHK